MGKLSVRIRRAQEQASNDRAWKRIRRVPTADAVGRLRSELPRRKGR